MKQAPPGWKLTALRLAASSSPDATVGAILVCSVCAVWLAVWFAGLVSAVSCGDCES